MGIEFHGGWSSIQSFTSIGGAGDLIVGGIPDTSLIRQQNDDGSYTITPDADYNGDLDLSFDIIDNDGGEVQVGLDITVNPLNDLPQAQDQQFTIEEDGTLLFTDADLLAGASDIDGDELSIENVL